MADRSNVYETETRETKAMYEPRTLRKLRHHDAGGLTSLLDDYLALADELEPVPETMPSSKRAA